MKLNRLQLGLCMLASVFMAGCGSPAPPLPPSLELARPVTDLRAVRKADTVYLTWSQPSETTDKENIRHPGVTGVCRSLLATTGDCATEVAKLPVVPGASDRKAGKKTDVRYADRLPEELERANPLSLLWYAVEVRNSYGRTAGLSNRVAVPAAPAERPPDDFAAQLGAEGVRLTWAPVTPPEISGLRFVYRVYRREAGGNVDQIVGELPVGVQPSLLDRNFEWEKTYDYRLTVLTLVLAANQSEQAVEGEDSPPQRVVAHDIFPPGVPAGLTAAFSGPGQKPFIDLVWTPNSESDLAGYKVYRREQDAEVRKMNPQLIASPAYRDSDIQPGHRYFYSVSAVDTRGNESARSEEAAETVPAND